MRCDRCGRDAVILQLSSGLRLCGDHLRLSLEARAKRTIRDHGWIGPGDRIAVALSGGPASSSLLHFLREHFGMRRDLSLVAITLDEGGRDMARIGALAEGTGVGWVPGSLSGEAGIPPAGCTWLRDQGLASLARRVGATKLALGTTLEDEARSVLLHVLRGEAARLAGRHSPGAGEIPCIRPFLRIPGEELACYARLTVPGHLPPREPLVPGEVEREARRMLADYSSRHPSAPFGIVNLGEALAGHAGPGRAGESPCGRCGEEIPPACPAREPVTGHG
jgi:tRNA(Ile)-lysidine synthase TilS/MesJ